MTSPLESFHPAVTAWFRGVHPAGPTAARSAANASAARSVSAPDRSPRDIGRLAPIVSRIEGSSRRRARLLAILATLALVAVSFIGRAALSADARRR